MRRKAHNRLWTFILALLLCGTTSVTLSRGVWADNFPGDPTPSGPPAPGAGDPDWPDASRTPKPGAPHGTVGRRDVPVAQSRTSTWVYKIRMALAAGFRALFFRYF